MNSLGNNVTVIVLASGNSSRFKNSLPDNIDTFSKIDIIIDGITLLEKTIKTLSKIDFSQIIVVVNSNKYDEIISKYNATSVLNENVDLGISNSIRLALECADNENDYMFFTSDMPKLNDNIITTLLVEKHKSKNKIIRPFYKDNFYNPVIFPNIYKSNLMNLKGDKGGASICTKENTVIIEKDMFKNLFDVDTYEEYLKLIK